MRALVVSACLVASLLVAVPATVPSAAPAQASAPALTAQASAKDECVAIDGLPLPASCAVSLEPTPLPQRRVIGEFEAGVLTRTGSVPTTSVSEFAAGGIAGSCDPATEVCSMSNRIGLRDDPRADTKKAPVPVADYAGGSAEGDAAQVATDLDGDGRQELVRATRCEGSSELCLSLFTPGDRDGENERYSAPQPTGLRVDTAGVGRIRVAAGPVALSATEVVAATFTVDDAQETTVATFTTDGRHSFKKGDPVRLGNDPSLQQALCVESSLARGGEQCIGDDLLSYRPITAVSATTFSVDLGVLIVAEKGVGHPVVPAEWQAECAGCGIRAEALSTAVVIAWAAPSASLQVATFSAQPQKASPFRLLDSVPVGALYRAAADAAVPSTEAVDVVVADFATGGPHEIAVAWAGTCTGAPGRACSRVSFLAMDDAVRLRVAATRDWGTSPWCAEAGKVEDVTQPREWSPTAVSLASGSFRSGSSTSDGADLAIGWTAVGAKPNRADHLVQTFDVTNAMALIPTTATDASAASDPEACATVLSRVSDVAPAARSRVDVAAADFDGKTGDELVIAETLPHAETAQLAVDAPVAVSLWSQGTGNNDGHGWRPHTRRQPALEEAWKQPFEAVSTAPASGYQATGGVGSGQISLGVGRLARRQSDNTADTVYPDGINPDVLLGWTCRDPNTCGDATNATPSGVAIDALGVSVGKDGLLGFAHEGSRVASVRGADLPAEPYQAAINERSYVDVTVADFDGNSSTLGDPVTSYSVGEVQPMMVMRAPPVSFLTIDGSHPGYDKDGWISSAEVYDLSNCYAGNGADTDTGDCPMQTSYLTEGGTESSLAVSVQNSWGLDTAAKAGFSQGDHTPGGDCASTACFEATLELAYAHSEEQQSEKQQTRSFRYTTEQVAAPMQDRAFVATSDIEINQVPVYYGTFAGGALPDEPDLWTYSATPLDTVFSWISTIDPQYGSVFAGPTPGNVLSYPASVSKLETRRTTVVSAKRESGNRLAVITSGNHGYLCELEGSSVKTAFPSAVGTQCAGQQDPVRLRGRGAFDGTDYIVAAVRTPTQIVLQRVGAAVPSGSVDCEVRTCTISRQPSELPVQTQEIGPGSSGSVSFEFGSVEGYEERYAVMNGASAEAATEGEVGDFIWEAHVKGEFEHNDESMMSMILESATTWGFDYGSASRPGSYRVTPYLADDPKSGALTLTWTAAPVGSSGLWGNPVWGYGAVGDPDLPPRPDPAFSLPLLAEPYRVHTGLDDNLDVIMSSPGFTTWACDEDHVCRPPAAHRVGQPLEVRATVHNYALTDLAASPSRPLLVRFYLGDPARGGYVIGQSRITAPIPKRGSTEVTASWKPPAGFAGQPGQPIYAVIDPDRTVDEVFDWETPVALTDRTLKGTVRQAATTTTVDGDDVFVFTTDTDHGLAVGDPVRVRKIPGYNVSDELVLATTATSFTVAADKRRPTKALAGTWRSVQEESCSSNNPWYGNAALDYYNFGDAEEFQTPCPSTNNEAYVLTPRFEGNRGGVTRSNLSVSPGDITVAKDRKRVVVDIGSATTLYGAQVTTRVWVCGGARTCSPQLAKPADRYEKTGKITVTAGGKARVRVPLGNTTLAKGKYRVGVQVIPLSTWERPGGPGYHKVANGTMADNQAIARVKVG